MTGFYLVILSFVLIIIEAHVPSFGIFGLAAIAALLAGGKMIVDAGGIFGIPLDWSIFLGIALSMAIITFVFARLIGKTLLKKDNISGQEGLLKEKAHIVEWSGKSGKITVCGELWNAVSQNAYDFKPNDLVKITSIDGQTVHISTHD